MTHATPSSNPPAISATEVADRVRSLQLGTTERKTAEFGLRGVVWLILLSLAGVGIWWATQNQETFGTDWKQWIPGGKSRVELIPVKVEGGEEILLDGAGYITPKNKVTVSARVPGLLVALNYDEGDKVEAGQVLAQLDDSTFRADLEQATAAHQAADSRLTEMKNGALPEELDQARTAVEQGRNKLELVEKQLKRMQALRKDYPEAEFEQMESTVSDAKANLKTLEQKLKLMVNGPRAERIRAAEAEVAQAHAMVTKAKTNLDNATLSSPITGVVLERHGAVGENIRPEAIGGGIFVLADLSQLEVQVDVEEQSLGKLKVGQPCRVIPDAYSNRKYSAKISRWQPQVNRARAVVRVILTITDPDELLLSEMNCGVVILSSVDTPKPETLWVPARAVLTEGSESAVFVAEEGVARKRIVKLGAAKDELVQVISGLTKDDRIVLSGNQPPAEGRKVP